MHCLPDEVLLMILENLSCRELLTVCSRVCRRWAALIERRVVRLRHGKDLHRLRSSVIALYVPVLLPSLSALLESTVRNAIHLRELTVHATMPFKESHLAILSTLPHLDHLDVFTSDRICNHRLQETASRLSSLVINESVASGFLRNLAAHDRLKALHMYGRSLYYPRAELFVLLRVRQEHLRELTLRCTELTDAAYDVIGECVNLVSLQLYSCWLMTGVGALYVTRPRRIRRLHVTGTYMVRRLAFTEFIRHLSPCLEELVVSSSCFSDEHVPILATSDCAAVLRVIEAWRCRLTARGVLALAEVLPALRTLDLDLPLTELHVHILRTHPTLQRLRHLPYSHWEGDNIDDTNISNINEKIEFSLNKNGPVRQLHVEMANSRYTHKYFRGGGEGFRANIYYYSMQDQDLKPLPCDKLPPYHDYIEIFY